MKRRPPPTIIDVDYRVPGEGRWAPLRRWWADVWPRYSKLDNPGRVVAAFVSIPLLPAIVLWSWVIQPLWRLMMHH